MKLKLIENMNVYAANRLAIYLLISLLTTLQKELPRINAGEITLTSWIDYAIFLIAITVPPLIVLRAFMDQAISSPKDQ